MPLPEKQSALARQLGWRWTRRPVCPCVLNSAGSFAESRRGRLVSEFDLCGSPLEDVGRPAIGVIRGDPPGVFLGRRDVRQRPAVSAADPAARASMPRRGPRGMAMFHSIIDARSANSVQEGVSR